MNKTHWLALCSAMVLAACQQNTSATAVQVQPQNNTALSNPAGIAARADANRIEAHMLFLADDALAGRDTGSNGHLIASHYIASQFQQLGLKPAGTDGYLQMVPLKQSKLVQSSPKLSFSSQGKTTELAFPKEFMTGPSSHDGKVTHSAELVFVGFGLVSKEFNIDDYAGLDVKGKVVVILPGRPEHLPSEEAAHISSQKAKLAAERGAVGMITLNTPKDEARRPFAQGAMYLHMPRMRWLHPDGTAEGDYPQLKIAASLDIPASKQLFAKAPQSYEQILAAVDKKQSPKGFALDSTVNFSRESTHEAAQSPNVAAVLEGSDPTLKNEYVVVTAHSDHIGVGADLRVKDRINNGLMDNAAGVAILLETARLFANAPVKPKRSILFVTVTGEEKGLLGADYFAHYPTRANEKLVANVNIDMPVLLYPFADMVAFGANHSTLGEVVAKAAGQYDVKLAKDPMPEQAIFTRSDHYTLVKQGVPAVFLMTGFTSRDPKQKGGDVWGKFFAKHYHKATDDVAGLTKDFGAIRYDYGALFADINYGITEQVANDPQRPLWKKDSFFGKIFGKEYNQAK